MSKRRPTTYAARKMANTPKTGRTGNEALAYFGSALMFGATTLLSDEVRRMIPGPAIASIALAVLCFLCGLALLAPLTIHHAKAIKEDGHIALLWKGLKGILPPLLFGAIVGFAIGFLLYGLPMQPPPQANGEIFEAIRSRREVARAALSLVPPEGAHKVRVGCLSESDRSCAMAAELLYIFSRAGWDIDGRKVYRMTTGIPAQGISVVTRRSPQELPLPDDPPHIGRLNVATADALLISSVMTGLGFTVRHEGDVELPGGVTGVYVGSTP